MVDEANTGPRGLGGWLILPILGLIVSPFTIGLTLVRDILPIFGDGTWEMLTSPSSELYHPLWEPLIWLELAGNVLLITLALVTLWFVFTKSRLAPRMMIAWLVFGALFVAADFVLAERIPMIAEQPADPDSVRDLIRTFVGAAIWIPYLLVSKRVRATFIK